MGRDGVLRMEIVDVFGNPVGELVELIFKNQTLTHNVKIAGKKATSALLIQGLEREPNGLYQLAVFSMSYRPVSRFVRIPASGMVRQRITLPVDPRKVQTVTFPNYPDLPPEGCRLLENSPGVLGFEGVSGPDLYSALPPLSRAGLLNILAKSRRTRLSNTRPVLSYFESLVEIRGDRFYVQTPHELREETKNSALAELFFEVNATLHRTKPGFSLAGSWKTPDNYGNLQLTFSTDGTNWMADVDIDDAAGIAHVFQVLRNAFTGPTHPYDIHQILIHHQELDPDYRFVL